MTSIRFTLVWVSPFLPQTILGFFLFSFLGSMNWRSQIESENVKSACFLYSFPLFNFYNFTPYLLLIPSQLDIWAHCWLVYVKLSFKVNQKAAESLADPEEYPNMFDNWQIALAVESSLSEKRYLLCRSIYILALLSSFITVILVFSILYISFVNLWSFL